MFFLSLRFSHTCTHTHTHRYIQHSACRGSSDDDDDDEGEEDTNVMPLLAYTCRVVTVLRERIPCSTFMLSTIDTNRVNAGIDTLRTLIDGVDIEKKSKTVEEKHKHKIQKKEKPHVRFKFNENDYDVGTFPDERPELPRVLSWEYTNKASRTKRNSHDLVCVWDMSSDSSNHPIFLVSLINEAFQGQTTEISRIRYRVDVSYAVTYVTQFSRSSPHLLHTHTHIYI